MDDLTLRFEDWLNEPMPDELSAEELEMRRRQRIAEENQEKIQRLVGLSGMERTRDSSQWAGGERR